MGRGYCQRHLYRLRHYGDPRDSRTVPREDYGDTMQCTKCGEVKPIDGFYGRYEPGGRKRRKCKACYSRERAARTAAMAPDDPTWRNRRDKALRVKYGIGLDDVERMEAAQDGVCALCGERPDYGRRRANGDRFAVLHVDHDHETGRVRGLLCNRCNWWIGYYEKHKLNASQVAVYLRDL